jgi:hypothetical protein
MIVSAAFVRKPQCAPNISLANYVFIMVTIQTREGY